MAKLTNRSHALLFAGAALALSMPLAACGGTSAEAEGSTIEATLTSGAANASDRYVDPLAGRTSDISPSEIPADHPRACRKGVDLCARVYYADDQVTFQQWAEEQAPLIGVDAETIIRKSNWGNHRYTVMYTQDVRSYAYDY